jgi:hypothetical protein
MQPVNTRNTLFLCLAGMIAFLPAAEAATISFNFQGADPSPYAVFGRSVIRPSNGVRVNSDAMQGGRFRLSDYGTGTYTAGFKGPDPLLWAFCIEPLEGISPGNYLYDVKPLSQGTTNIGGMGQAKADRLRELFGRWYPDFTQAISALAAGALQIAVWELVREDSGTLDIYNGTIYFYSNASTTPGVLALAQTYVQSINGTGPKLTNLVALTKAGTQDLVVQSEIPEPGSLLLAGIGLLGFGIARNRMKRS